MALATVTELFLHKAPEGTEYTRRHGLRYDEASRRWKRPTETRVASNAVLSPILSSKLDPVHAEGLNTLLNFLQKSDTPVYLFGGTLRDLYMGTQPKDLDFRVGGDYDQFVSKFKQHLGKNYIGTHRDNMISEVHFQTSGGDLKLDFVPYEYSTIDEDLRTRDFTINAMALPMHALDKDDWQQHVLDPTGGVRDLKLGIIRQLRSDSMEDDPIRILRAFRFARRLGFKIDDATYAGMVENVELLKGQSGRRIRNETMKILTAPNSIKAVRDMDRLGILSAILPELTRGRGVEQPANRHYYDVLEHQFQALHAIQPLLEGNISTPVIDEYKDHFAEVVGEGYTRADLLTTATLLHDVGKPDTKGVNPKNDRITFHRHEDIGGDIIEEVAERLRFDKKSKKYMEEIVRHHMRPWTMAKEGELPSKKAVQHFAQKAGDAAPGVLLLNIADLISARGPELSQDEWKQRMAFMDKALEILNQQKHAAKQPRLLTGHDLIAMGIPAGPQLGKLLPRIHDAQVRGDITTSEEAIELLDQLRAELNIDIGKSAQNTLLEVIFKAEPRVKPPSAIKYGWEWDEERHHWVLPEYPSDVDIPEKFISMIDEAKDAVRDQDYIHAWRMLDEARTHKFGLADSRNITYWYIAKLQNRLELKIGQKWEANGVEGMLEQGQTELSYNVSHEMAHNYRPKTSPAFVDETSDNWNDIRDYLGDDESMVNKSLRGQLNRTPERKQTIKGLMDSMKRIGERKILYRGLKGLDDPELTIAQEGDVITSRSFVSTSRTPFIAKNFAQTVMGGAGNYTGYMLEIRTHPDTEAIVLPNSAGPFQEYETILNAHQSFKVVKIRDRASFGDHNFIKYIVLEAISTRQQKIDKSPQGTEWTKEHGLEFDENIHRWVVPKELEEGNIPLRNLSIIENLIQTASERYKEENYGEALLHLKNLRLDTVEEATDSQREALETFVNLISYKIHMKRTQAVEEARTRGRGLLERGESIHSLEATRQDAVDMEKRIKPKRPAQYGPDFEAYVGSWYSSINTWMRVGARSVNIPEKLSVKFNEYKKETPEVYEKLEKLLAQIHQYSKEGQFDEAHKLSTQMYFAASGRNTRHLFTGNINNFLTEVQLSTNNQLANSRISKSIRTMTDAMESLGSNDIYYRGMDVGETFYKDVKEGDIVRSRAFMSTSRNPAIALRFARRKGVLEIHSNAQLRGVHFSTSEYETLLDLGQPMRIKEIRQDIEFGPNKLSHYLVLEVITEEEAQKEEKIGAKIHKSPQGTDWTREHGLTFDENIRRWVLPDAGKFEGSTRHKKALGLIRHASELFSHREYEDAISRLSDLWYLGASAANEYGKQVAERAQSLIQHVQERLVKVREAKEKSGQRLSQWGFNDDGLYIATEQAKKFNPWKAPSFQDDNLPAIESYTGAGYRSMNVILRGQWKNENHDPARTAMYKERIKKIQDLMLPMQEPQILYRGIRQIYDTVYGDAEVGQEITNDAFMSSSRDPDVAIGFSKEMSSIDKGKGVVLEILSSPQIRAITLSGGESETILDAKQQFRVKEIHENVYIRGEVISRYIVLEHVTTPIKIQKAPPGAKPEKFGDDVVWDEQKHHWVLPWGPAGENLSPVIHDSLRDAINSYRSKDYQTTEDLLMDAINAVGEPKTQHTKEVAQRLGKMLSLLDQARTKGGDNQGSGLEGPFAGGLDESSWKKARESAKSYDYKNAPTYMEYDNTPMGSIDAYVGEGYESVNMLMRENKLPDSPLAASRNEAQQMIRAITDAMKPMQEPVILFRGVDTMDFTPYDNAIVGGTVIPTAFMSTSRDPEIAYDFSEDELILEIHPSADTRAITLGDHGQYGNEHETILDRGQSFKVKEIRENVQIGHRFITKYMVLEIVSAKKINKSLDKAAPGSVPEHFTSNVVWDDEKHHWVLPEDSAIDPSTRDFIQDITSRAAKAYKEGKYDYARIFMGDLENVTRYEIMDKDAKDKMFKFIDKLHDLIHKKQFADMGPISRLSEMPRDDISWDAVNEEAKLYEKKRKKFVVTNAFQSYVGSGYQYINGLLRGNLDIANVTLPEFPPELREDLVKHFNPDVMKTLDKHFAEIHEAFEAGVYSKVLSGIRSLPDEIRVDKINDDEISIDYINHLVDLAKTLKDIVEGVMAPFKIKRMIDEMYNFDGPDVLYRGVSPQSNNPYWTLQQGDIFRPAAFMSTSRIPNIADGFGTAMVEIQVNENTRGIYLDTGEYETVLEPKQAFRVKEIHDNFELGYRTYSQYFVLEAISEEEAAKEKITKSNINKIFGLLKDSEHPGTEYTREHGLQFDEESRRWESPDGDEETQESQERVIADVVKQLDLDNTTLKLIQSKNAKLEEVREHMSQFASPEQMASLPDPWPEDSSGLLRWLFKAKDYQTALEKSLDNSSMYIAIKSSNLKKVLKDGAFKNSAETGKGTFKKIGNERFETIEKPVFGLSDESMETPSTLPKYGFLASKDQMDYEDIVGWGYGDVFVKFKPQVKERSSFTIGDSFDGNSRPTSITPASSLSKPNADLSLMSILDIDVVKSRKFGSEHGEQRAKDWINDPTWQNLKGMTHKPYLETQTFGELSINDIESLEVESIKQAVQLRKMLDKAELQDVHVKPAKLDSRIKAVLEWDYNKSPSLNSTDIDNLGDDYIDQIITHESGILYMGWKDRRPEYIEQLSEKYNGGRSRGTDTSQMSMEEKRTFLKVFTAEQAKKDNGSLPKIFWEKYAPTKAGWTEDVLNKQHLKTYKNFGYRYYTSVL